MCGIVGYTGYRDALPVLLDSLERVTYRGYDSFGVALQDGLGIQVSKRVGTVEEHRSQVVDTGGSLGIGHTRWATVGGVSDGNAHPHSDCSGNLAIVHNGDIDNYNVLRQRLQDQGHRFQSQTDSEVIAHLIEDYCGRNGDDVVDATRRAIVDLNGPFAIAVLHRPTRGMVVARRESPLVVGLGEGEVFVASDVPAILPYTNRMVYLEDGDMALVWEGGMQTWHQDRLVERQEHRIGWNADQMDKAGYQHFMLKEIHEQPGAIAATVSQAQRRWESEAGAAPSGLDAVLLLGCGTSYHAALVGEQLISRALDVPVTAQVASELQKGAFQASRGLAIALSQSGETSDTINALRAVKERGYATLGITNVMGSSLTRMVDSTFYTVAGPEVAVASTKTFLTQLVALYMLAQDLAPEAEWMEGLAEGLQSLPRKVRQVLLAGNYMEEVAQELAPHDHMFIIAKGLDVPVAMEGALKFKEVAYLHAEGYAAGELKHGPFALLGQGTPVIALVPSGEHRLRVLTCIKEVKARGARVIAVADYSEEGLHELVDTVIPIPRANPLLAPLLRTVVLQLLSYYCAGARGCPIDRPRNLAKSVTVP